MLGLPKLNLFVLGSLLAPAFAATITAGNKGIDIRAGRSVMVGGVFSEGETVLGKDIGMGGMIVASADQTLISDVIEGWQRAQGASSGIYYELQELELKLYEPVEHDDGKRPWPANILWAAYLPPMNIS
ncbi:hypothetical protein FGRMN_9347 [Fusarium graminum]|nr:hypothetical protein FGRMN_9347 [Fusarium graminum]